MSLEHSPTRAGVRTLRLKQVCARLNVSPSTIWEWVKQGQFPRPVELGSNTRVWLEHELDAHVLERARARDQQGMTED
jgi:prophage regulatory protein